MKHVIIVIMLKASLIKAKTLNSFVFAAMASRILITYVKKFDRKLTSGARIVHFKGCLLLKLRYLQRLENC